MCIKIITLKMRYEVVESWARCYWFASLALDIEQSNEAWQLIPNLCNPLWSINVTVRTMTTYA